MESELRKSLAALPLGGLRYYPQTGSTNDLALAWAAQGAADLSLIVADEQTSGRGRMNRKWFTPPGAALALSLILRPSLTEAQHPALFAGLGALALSESLAPLGIPAHIKWPNDVLIRRKKAAGILVETVWLGEKADSIILGMGINIFPESIPPASQLNFPATCLQAETDTPLQRFAILRGLLQSLLTWRTCLNTPAFIAAWQSALEFRGETVQIWQGEATPKTGTLVGLAPDGALRLRLPAGVEETIRYGEVHLRPTE